jgi:CRISPR/Cas system-associated exonuclease Cas4 (RecB family)
MTTDINDEDYVEMMCKTLKERYSRPRTGMHISDIVYCPRQRVFKEIDPLPVTDKDLNLFSSGRAIHEAVQSLFMSDPGRFEKEMYVDYKDIEGHIDIFDKKRKAPIEFKTRRSKSIDEPKDFQVEQLKYYMAMQGSSQGYMIYQCLMQFEGDSWRQFPIHMNKKQRNEQLKKLVREITSLQNAVKEKDPSLARDVNSDVDLNWLCKGCPYAKKCERIRVAAVGAAA